MLRECEHKTSCSETPNSSDCINRQAVIDAIVNTVSEIGLHDNSEVARYGATFRQHEIIDIIEGMSSAQPDIIRCKDCVNYHYNTKEQGERFVCALDGFIWKPEDYCSYAERKMADDDDEID